MTLDQLTEVLRNRLGLPPNEIPRLKTLVNVAIQGLVEHAAAHLDKRHYVFTDPNNVTADLDANGIANLLPLIVSEGVILEGLRFGEITHPDSPRPLKPISGTGEASMDSPWTTMGFLRYFLVGTKLHTISLDNNATPLVGAIALAVPFANGLANLNIQMQDELIDQLVLQERGAPREQAVTA